MNHLLLVFTDGSQLMLDRTEHQGKYSHEEAGLTGATLQTVHHLRPGDVWPPVAPEEAPSAEDLDAVAQEQAISTQTAEPSPLLDSLIGASEVPSAMDQASSSQVSIVGEPAQPIAEAENDGGAAPQPEAGAREEGQQGTQEAL